MKIKVLCRPQTPGPKQDAWDEAEQILLMMDWERYRGRRRKARGSRRSRKLFLERVVARAIQRQSNQIARAHALRQENGEIVEFALGDWQEKAIYSTVTFG